MVQTETKELVQTETKVKIPEEEIQKFQDIYKQTELEDALAIELGEIKDKSWDYGNDDEELLIQTHSDINQETLQELLNNKHKKTSKKHHKKHKKHHKKESKDEELQVKDAPHSLATISKNTTANVTEAQKKNSTSEVKNNTKI